MVMFAILCVLIGLGRYFARHKGNAAGRAITLDLVHGFKWGFLGGVSYGREGMDIKVREAAFCDIQCVCFPPPNTLLLCPPGTYFTHEAKGADDAADADTAIINAEGGHNNTDEKKEYYI